MDRLASGERGILTEYDSDIRYTASVKLGISALNDILSKVQEDISASGTAL